MIHAKNDPDTFKLAMRRFTSTVCLITTQTDSVRYGMAATAVQSVSADPPTILVCVNQAASLSVPLKVANRFCVNMLSLQHAELVGLFSGKLKGEERFQHGHWSNEFGLPMLADCQGAFVCALQQIVTVGSHDVLIGRVEHSQFAEPIDPLLYCDGKLARSVVLE